MPRISRSKIRFFPLKLSGGGSLAATKRKGAKGAAPAGTTGFTLNPPWTATKTINGSNGVNTLFGTSQGATASPTAAINQILTVSGVAHGPLDAEIIRIFTGSEPGGWPVDSQVTNMENSSPTVPYVWTFKEANIALAGATPSTMVPGNAFYDKWLDIFANQWPDVAKFDNQGNPYSVGVGAHHEPYADTGMTTTNWSNMQINLCKIVTDANRSRTNKLRVHGIFNGFVASSVWDSWYNPVFAATGTYLGAVTNAVYVPVIDCYAIIDPGTVKQVPPPPNSPQYNGNVQMRAFHTWLNGKGGSPAWNTRWGVGELGFMTDNKDNAGGATDPRPTAACASYFVDELTSDLNTWNDTAPQYINWWNAGSSSWNADGAWSNSFNVQLPQAFDKWHALAIKNTGGVTGLVPSNTLTPSTTLTPNG